MDPFSLFSPDIHVCKLLPLGRWFTWICGCDAFAVGHLLPAKLCSACCSFKRCVSSPFSMPSSRKVCLPRAMLSSPILNGVSRYLFFPFSHSDAKYSPWEWVRLVLFTWSKSVAWPANYKALLSEGEGLGSPSKGARICLPVFFFFL